MKLLLILILAFIISILIEGCSCKPKLVYVKPNCPKLQTFKYNYKDINTTLEPFSLKYEVKDNNGTR